MTKKQAIARSIRHWESNVRKLDRARGKFRRYGGSQVFRIGRITIYYDTSHCALCQYTQAEGGCTECVLQKGTECSSAWHRLADATTRRQALTHARALLKQLKSLRRKA